MWNRPSRTHKFADAQQRSNIINKYAVWFTLVQPYKIGLFLELPCIQWQVPYSPAEYIKAIYMTPQSSVVFVQLHFSIDCELRTRTWSLLKMHGNSEHFVSRLMLHFNVHATHIQQSILELSSYYLDEIEAQLPLYHKTKSGFSLQHLGRLHVNSKSAEQKQWDKKENK